MPAKLKSIAVLIDADNASAKNIDYILQEIENIGHITCKKIYGDWGNAHIQSWQEALLKYAIDPMQHFAYVKGKNATDIGMVIEAMDLLYSNNYDGFCLISSDSDFTSLALRIRKNHVKVFGFGKRNTVSAFSQACDKFFYVEGLLGAQKKLQNAIDPPAYDSNKLTQHNNAKTNSKTVAAWNERRLKSDTKLLNSLRTSIIDHPKADAKCWVNIGAVNSLMQENHPEFDSKNYGYPKITTLIKKIDLFETKIEKSTFYVRINNGRKTPVPLASNQKHPTWTTENLQKQTHLIRVLNQLIKGDPNSDKGWSNTSYLASQIKQNYKNINLDKYGYKKFSDLIVAIDLYETRKNDSALSIKIKTKNNTLEPTINIKKPKIGFPIINAELNNDNSAQTIPDEHTTVTVYSSSQTDIRLFCMNSKEESKGAKDIIHTDNRHSKDCSILLTRKEKNGISKSIFICNLHKQGKDTDRLIFAVISKFNNTFSKNCPNIELTISNRHKSMLFSEEFNVQNKTGKNLLLFTLDRIGNGWQFSPRNTVIGSDLRELCHIPDSLKL